MRPEKIRLIPARRTATETDGEVRATGTVRDVLYLGERTKYLVALDGGGQLEVVEQNSSSSEIDISNIKNAAVRLAWDRRFDQLITEGET